MSHDQLLRLLGIDALTEPQLLWIAQLACAAAVPEEWKEFTNDEKKTMFYNTRTKVVQQTHPVIEKYGELVAKQRGFSSALQCSQASLIVDDNSERFSAVLKQINERNARKLSVSTPMIIEQLAALVHVDSKKEFYLLRCIKLTLEAYVQKKYDLSTLVSDLVSPMKFLRVVFSRQIKKDVTRPPRSVTICQECEKRSAVIKCGECEDFFCQECFNSLHATGNRRGHLTEDVEQLVCSVCDMKVGTCQCVQCGAFYCDSCFQSTHSARSELHNHIKRVISGLVCQECEHFNASVICEDCVDLFCTECFIKLHKKGRRRMHLHLTIDNTGQVFRGGYLVSPEEAQVIIEKSKETTDSGPWVSFKDDQATPYWYNFALSITSYSEI